MTMPRTPTAKLTKPGIPNAPKKPKATIANASIQEESVTQEEIAVQGEKMSSTSTDGKEDWSDQTQAEEEAREAFKSSTRMLRSPRKRIEAPIPTTPKKSKVRPTIEEIEEIEENDEPSKPTRSSPRPAAKPIEMSSTNDTPEPPSSPSKMLLQTAIGMIKRSKDKLVAQKPSTLLRDEVVPELDDVISFMEALQAMEDNMATVKRELKEVKETIMETARAAKTTPNTWATVAAMPRTPTQRDCYREQELDEENQQKQAQRRQERAKVQVTLTAEGASRATQANLTSKTYKEITERFQKIADKTATAGPPLKIGGFQVLKSNDIRFTCDSAEEANRLRKIDWSKAFEGLEVRQPKFGIVIHGVPIEEINPRTDNLDDIADEIGDRNSLKVVKLRTLRAPSKLDPMARNNSYVVLTHDVKAADKCLKKGIFINCRLFNTEKYTPQYQLTQCYKCQRYGHKAGHCRGKEKCARCGDDHATKDCQTNARKCANCGDDHPAWHPECSRRTEESERLDELKFKAKNAYYNE